MAYFESRPYQLLYDLVRKNKIMNHWAHKIMQSERVRNFGAYKKVYNDMVQAKALKLMKVPAVLEFELTNKCNARCIMCPPEIHLGSDFIDHALYQRIIKEAYDVGIRKLILTGGEPFLDRLIIEKIDFAKKTGFTYIHIFSNGSLLHEAKQEKLLRSGVDSITVSVDSAIKEEYERIRRQLNFDKVVENVRSIYAMKKRLGLKSPIFRVNMVALPENMNSRKQFIETFKGHADIVEIMDAHNFAGDVEVNIGSREYTQISRDPCHILFFKAVVTAQGYLKKCSIDQSEHAKILDLRTNSLKNALESIHLLQIKQNHLKRNFCEPGCPNCSHRESWWVDYRK